uniref:Aurora kinase A and ninein interacting protein n=1 Tax=Periophthalmus magnuspinnatus TaxID=409849 RepID=A0A3B3ZC19_9GOBI
MKTSRGAAQSRVQREEDCDVWIDTAQLKGKVQKKRLARPISKLLNPFTRGSGYNVAVALNFTQTKMEMPKTKQSSISNFFTCQRRGRPNTSAQEVCLTTATATGDSNDSKNEPLWSDVDYKQLTEPHAAMWWEKEDEECLFNAEGRTSTQKTFKGPSLQSDKENTIPKYPKMPTSHGQVMSKQTKLETLQNYSSLETCTQDPDEPYISPIKWTKPKNSPKKKTKCHFRDSDDENLSMLFTQDSQGFRVIAHRGLQTRSPLKDQRNITIPVLSPAVKSLEEDEDEEEMLFTQDSQGNIVIKH